MQTSKQTVLITGGSSGIGFELAKQLLALGNTVIITGRDLSKLEACKQKLPGLHILQSDAGDPHSIATLHAKVTQEFPSLNILINNAGIMRKINLQAQGADLHDISREIEINLNGPIRMVQQFLPQLLKQPSAAIMNVSSGLAFVPLPISPIYCATKAGLHSYSLSLRAQLKRSSIKVFELAPPLTATELLAGFESKDMEGIQAMPVAELVKHAIAGLAGDKLEIRPGSSNALKMMNRIAPGFILGQLSKSVDAMLAKA